MATVRLFVYGSLKRDGEHHDQLRGARFLGEAATAPGFELVSILVGAVEYRALVRASDSGASVSGELFEVPAVLLPALDDFEGEDYVRGEVPLSSGGARVPVASALAYFKKSD